MTKVDKNFVTRTEKKAEKSILDWVMGEGYVTPNSSQGTNTRRNVKNPKARKIDDSVDGPSEN